ncbi:MAG TPA: hypothetical protein VLJ15_08100 [Gammaproteobacteria bacterium]|nr:hypothetical protein [Gammaproteobacteria bacterium]
MTRHFFLKIILLFLITPVFADDIPDPCTGLLSLINRPSITGSACTVPNKKIVAEGGYHYLHVSGNVHGYIVPQAEIRFGLPGHNEFLILAPTYFHQTTAPAAGWSAVSLSAKHEVGYNANWLGAVEGVVTLPTGSEAYGSRAVGGMANGILMYTVSPALSITGILGVMSTSVQYIHQGARFNSINPDIFANWSLNDKWQLFAELYAQTRTGPGEGWGLLTDAGLFYLVTPRVALDAEVGQRITGAWGFQTYASGGVAVFVG